MNAPWMDVARAEIGVEETPGPGTTPRIREYHQHTSLLAKDDETAWCASFVNWVLDKAGYPANHKPNARSFLELLDWHCHRRVLAWRPGRLEGARRLHRPHRGRHDLRARRQSGECGFRRPVSEISAPRM
jgi:uncharacterized protein (TIGR02594 family)